ncbi:MAG: GntR family transcriptional regulator [Spirochaetales bacterium]|nr:GntR family transcriptional regulator [Spirochaetales bacterium]MCF7937494.1 GntR family transcriptional regulator [Spirochaetales bacterium]
MDADIDTKIEFASLSEQVYNHIKRMILTAELKGGEKVPEEKIASIFGVSRTPIREALRKLEKQGLIQIIPRRYAQVTQIEPVDKIHVGQVRYQLDSLSVQLLALKATEEDYRALKSIADQCNQAAESADFATSFEKDSQLHCEFARRSGNPYLYDLVKNMDVKVQLLRNIEDISVDNIRRGIALHIPIIEAIYAHDPEKAEKLVKQHLADYYFPEEGHVE